ncbi:MAG TPA: nuclear transport factor 2 family protein [Streptosporangiaceae bacterium]|nr:nuclear transport factor 2 family protein [Streptosporangiaceae bacterium]
MIIALPVSLWWNRNRSIEDGSREELGMDEERRVQDVLARYVRTTDRRDGKAQGALFTDDATVEIQIKTGQGQYEKLGDPLTGGAGVAFAVDNFMTPHPQGGSSHHTTSDHIIEISGDQAHMNAQFIVYEVLASTRPEDGWPDDARGAQGTVRTIESGYYDTDLRLIDGQWKITGHRVLMDMPMAFPGA